MKKEESKDGDKRSGLEKLESQAKEAKAKETEKK